MAAKEQQDIRRDLNELIKRRQEVQVGEILDFTVFGTDSSFFVSHTIIWRCYWLIKFSVSELQVGIFMLFQNSCYCVYFVFCLQ